MRDEIDQFQRAGATPFGVNPAGLESHRRYVAKFSFPFVLLSDAGRTVAAAYGALQEDGRRIQRSVVLIDQRRRVRFAERGSPTPEAILAALAGE